MLVLVDDERERTDDAYLAPQDAEQLRTVENMKIGLRSSSLFQALTAPATANLRCLTRATNDATSHGNAGGASVVREADRQGADLAPEPRSSAV